MKLADSKIIDKLRLSLIELETNSEDFALTHAKFLVEAGEEENTREARDEATEVLVALEDVIVEVEDLVEKLESGEDPNEDDDNFKFPSLSINYNPSNSIPADVKEALDTDAELPEMDHEEGKVVK